MSRAPMRRYRVVSSVRLSVPIPPAPENDSGWGAMVGYVRSEWVNARSPDRALELVAERVRNDRSRTAGELITVHTRIVEEIGLPRLESWLAGVGVLRERVVWSSGRIFYSKRDDETETEERGAAIRGPSDV